MAGAARRRRSCFVLKTFPVVKANVWLGRTVNARTAQVPSHAVIEDYLAEYGRDYRYEDAPHPVKALQDREKDNTRVGRTRSCTK